MKCYDVEHWKKMMELYEAAPYCLNSRFKESIDKHKDVIKAFINGEGIELSGKSSSWDIKDRTVSFDANLNYRVKRRKELKNPYSHLIMYTKDHYVINRVIDDLRIITGHRFDREPHCIGIEFVRNFVVDAAFKHILGESRDTGLALRGLIQFISMAPDKNMGGLFKGLLLLDNYDHRLIYSALRYLRDIPVTDGLSRKRITLDPPDPDVLPLTDHGRKNMIEQI